jgi:phosphonoacetaldehyde hydrolase
VIFDWAGTLVDFGSTAPTSAMVELFRQHDVTVTEEDVRSPMGLGKREHILAMSKLPGVMRSWQAAFGRRSN